MAFVHTRLERVAPFLSKQQRRDFALQALLKKNLVVESLTELSESDQKVISNLLKIADSKLLELVTAWQLARESEQISLTELIAQTDVSPVKPSEMISEGCDATDQPPKRSWRLEVIDVGIGWDELSQIGGAL